MLANSDQVKAVRRTICEQIAASVWFGHLGGQDDVREKLWSKHWEPVDENGDENGKRLRFPSS